MRISYAITVCNELKELTSLINFLLVRVDSEDQIVIQYDTDSVTKEVVDYLTIIGDIQKQIKITSFPLNKDFASFKNNLKSHCEGDYIFQIDADEEPSETLLERLKQILTVNEVDIIFVPRVNTVKGLTETHIQQWGWRVDEKGWVNWPDYQTRIYKNTEEVQWYGKVHERITGYTTFTNFPADEKYSLYHHKEIERQEKQNKFYDNI
ncbi:glycosyltransferase [archaeon]|nr:glycosyltransferase [archaeon]NDB55839.1 glycosyltransferase [archaeon]